MSSVQTHDGVGPCAQEFRVYNECFSFGRQSIVPTFCAPQAAVIEAALLPSPLLTRSQHSHRSAIYISYFSSRVAPSAGAGEAAEAVPSPCSLLT